VQVSISAAQCVADRFNVRARLRAFNAQSGFVR
jgi:hypothetical protein